MRHESEDMQFLQMYSVLDNVAIHARRHTYAEAGLVHQTQRNAVAREGTELVVAPGFEGLIGCFLGYCFFIP